MREQGDSMEYKATVGFEIKVLDMIDQYLNCGERAEFYSGTLYLECIESNARMVFSQLMRKFDNKVNITSPENGTYCIDFTA